MRHADEKFDPWPADKPLYKYLDKVFAERLFDLGEIKIGTLYDFRKQGEHGDVRGDKNEGIKSITEDVNVLNIRNLKADSFLSPHVKDFINLPDNSTNILIENCNFTKFFNSNDMYIYCMSSIFNKKLYKAFECPSCIRIKSPIKFMHSLSILMRNHANNYHTLSKCIYKERTQYYGDQDNLHSAIIKPLDYSYQKEVRALWVPISESPINTLS